MHQFLNAISENVIVFWNFYYLWVSLAVTICSKVTKKWATTTTKHLSPNLITLKTLLPIQTDIFHGSHVTKNGQKACRKDEQQVIGIW